MKQVVAYLFFKGNCAEAMEFYKSSLGGELTLQKVGDTPMAEQMPDSKEMVMHSELTGDGWKFYASDMMDSSSQATPGNTVSVAFVGSNIAEIKPAFDALAVGGKITQELKEEYFGTYGDLVDKYGFRWMFQADGPTQAAPSAAIQASQTSDAAAVIPTGEETQSDPVVL